MTERALQAKVLRRLRKAGGVWLNKSPSPWDPEGLADILGCYEGMFVAIELKQPGKYLDPHDGLSDAQARFLEEVQKAGGVALCCDSWEQVERGLAAWGIVLAPAACYRKRRPAA